MDDLNKSIDAFLDDLFAEDVQKSEDLNVAAASKTTADAVMAEVPKAEDDESRGAGRPKGDHDVPETDEDGNKAKGYESVQSEQAETEPEEAKKQAKAVTQISSEGHMGERASMKDPRLSKSEQAEYAEFVAFKKAQAEAKEQETLKKAEDLKKAEQERLVKSAVESALAPLRKENEELKKSFAEQSSLIKAMAGMPRQSKSVTNIQALEKSFDPSSSGPTEFSKSEKLDAAEALAKANKLPIDAVIELEQTNSIANLSHRAMVEQFLLNGQK